MIEKLRKKLMVLFLTCTMLIFTAAMLVMAGNAVSQTPLQSSCKRKVISPTAVMMGKRRCTTL